jgi:hypothetical protein
MALAGRSVQNWYMRVENERNPCFRDWGYVGECFYPTWKSYVGHWLLIDLTGEPDLALTL